MRAIADKAVVLAACVALAAAPHSHGGAIAALLASVALSGLSHTLPARAAQWLPLPGLLLGFFFASVLPSVPLLAYDVARHAAPTTRLRAANGAAGGTSANQAAAGTGALVGAVALVAVIARWLMAALRQDAGGAEPAAPDLTTGWEALGGQSPSMVAVVAASALAALLAWRTSQAEATLEQVYSVRDALQAKLVSLHQINARLQEAQEFETRAGVLAERTRIAREMHDGVGHSLTGLLFRVKALEVIHRERPELVEQLAELGGGLDQAMSAMRASVHALADDAEDLPTALNLLAGRCGIARVSVDCSVGERVPARVSRCFVAVTREALTNALRHGRATSAAVNASEFPGFWRLHVSNDGVLPGPEELAVLNGEPGRPAPLALPAGGGASALTNRGGAQQLPSPHPGMGLRNMRDRVESLGGNLRIETGGGFSVVAMIPKEEACE